MPADDIEPILAIMRALSANLISTRTAIDAMNNCLDGAPSHVPVGTYVKLRFTKSERLYVVAGYDANRGMYHIAAAAEPYDSYWPLLRCQFCPVSPLEALTMDLSHEEDQ